MFELFNESQDETHSGRYIMGDRGRAIAAYIAAAEQVTHGELESATLVEDHNMIAACHKGDDGRVSHVIGVPKFALWRSMITGKAIGIRGTVGNAMHYGIVQSISREDGSGSSFIVTLHNDARPIYIRTID